MFAFLKENEIYLYLVLFFLGIQLRIKELEYVAVSLYLISSIVKYIRTKKLSEFLSLLFCIAIFNFVIFGNIISDINFLYHVFFIIALSLIFYFIKLKLYVKLHNKEKFWNINALIISLTVYFLTSFYFIAFGSFIPTFSGKYHIDFNQNKKIYYDYIQEQKDVEKIANLLENFKIVGSKSNEFKLVDKDKSYLFLMHLEKKKWNDDDFLDYYYLYEDSLNKANLSKKVRIGFVVKTIWGRKISIINPF